MFKPTHPDDVDVKSTIICNASDSDDVEIGTN